MSPRFPPIGPFGPLEFRVQVGFRVVVLRVVGVDAPLILPDLRHRMLQFVRERVEDVEVGPPLNVE